MALRRRLAERISTVKAQAGLEAPILKEVPVPAKIVSSEIFFSAESITSLKQVGRVGILPVIVKGEAKGDIAGLWYKVRFPRAMIHPQVVAVAEARKGVRPDPGQTPKLAPLEKLAKIPEIKALDKILETGIPKLKLPHIRETIGEFVVSKPYGCPPICPPGTGLVQDLAKALNKAVDVVEAGLKRINDIVDKIDYRLEKIRTTLNTKLTEIDDRLDTLRTKVNDRLAVATADVDDRFETLRTNTNTVFSGLFPRLYSAWGQRSDMALTTVNVRNVTGTGFEFLSMGDTTIHYIAIGKRI